MIRKLMCWLGWHEWETWLKGFTGSHGTVDICKHCGTIKRENDTQNNLRITDE